jgi:nitric oxide synthase-interacting protein
MDGFDWTIPKFFRRPIRIEKPSMSRHSQNAASRPYYTSGERKKLTYGTQTHRIGVESLHGFNCCGLCLQTTTKPVLTPYGNLYCKEHILENLVKQKKEFAKRKEQYEYDLKRHQLEIELEEQVKNDNLRKKLDSIVDLPVGPNDISTKSQDLWKHKTDAVVDKKKPDLPKDETIDPSCMKPLKLRQLIDVHFTPVKNSKDKFQCPACSKEFVGGLKGYVLSTCGHTVCSTCSPKFILTEMKCIVCSEKLTSKKDLIEIQGTGTSFAASSGEKTKIKTWEPTMTIS